MVFAPNAPGTAKASASDARIRILASAFTDPRLAE